MNDDRFRSGDSVRAYGIRTALCVPVRSGRRIMGVIHVDSSIADFSDRLEFIGLFTSLLFVVGMPLVPLWGVWADKYSRKAVIVRSAVVEAVVYGGVALAREPWQVALCLLLVGFQLGNTGVMLAAIRDVAPIARLGAILGVFGASTAVGMAVGPALAGLLIDGFGWAIAAVFGFGGIATASADIAKVLFYIFLAVFVISLLMGRRRV